MGARWPVSRVLSPPAIRLPGRERWMTIHLGRPLPDASRDQPGRRRGNALGSWPSRPYSVLLPVGFTMPSPLPEPRCALTAPFHPCRPTPETGPGAGLAVFFLWHFPWGRPRRALPGTVFPWSPDFPLPMGSHGKRPSSHLAAGTLGTGRVRCNRIAMPTAQRGGNQREARASVCRTTARSTRMKVRSRPNATRSGTKCRWNAVAAMRVGASSTPDATTS